MRQLPSKAFCKENNHCQLFHIIPLTKEGNRRDGLSEPLSTYMYDRVVVATAYFHIKETRRKNERVIVTQGPRLDNAKTPLLQS